MKTLQLYAFLTSALYGDKWSAWRPSRFTARKRDPDTVKRGGWVAPSVGLDAVTKIPAPAWNRTHIFGSGDQKVICCYGTLRFIIIFTKSLRWTQY